MDSKSKIIPIVLLVVVLTVAFIAFNFYNETIRLKQEKAKLTEDNKNLVAEKEELRNENDSLVAQKKEAEAKAVSAQQKTEELAKENESLKVKYDRVSQEREDLAQQLQKQQQKGSKVEVTSTSSGTGMPSMPSGSGNTDYWSDFVKTKAELETKLDNLNRELMESKGQLAEMDKNNKELSITIDTLKKKNEELTEAIRFKESTMNVMGRDLVSERESRKNSLEELNKLRGENVNLKRELVLANKEKIQLSDRMRDLMNKKDELESKVSEIESIMKEKSLALDEMQQQITKAIRGGKEVTAKETASVELPPIVVKPEAAGIRGLRGGVVAVNPEEKFVVIDLGEDAGVKPGLKLRVVRGDRDIGIVEVIETRKEISAADVKEVVSGYNIQEGDIVISR
jgi:chromosome segregation ATPase